MAGFHHGAAERNRQVRLAHAGRPEDQDILRLRQKAAGPQLANQALVDRRLKLEIEVVEGLDRREVRDLQTHGDAGALLRVDLLAQEPSQEATTRGLGPRGVIQHTVEALRHVAEPQPRELLDDARMHDRTHGVPPAMTVAYVVRS